MNVAVLGTGDVGIALGNAFITLGHEVMMGARSATNERALAWARGIGRDGQAGTFGAAVEFGELILLATLGVANAEVIRSVNPEAFRGKIVIDTTNPLDFSKGFPPSLAVGHTDSGGEQVQRLLPDAHVVKAFNTVGHAHMFRPDFPGGPPDMFICGNDDEAKLTVASLLTHFGWNTVDLGGIEGARYLEPMCMLWVLSAARSGNWNQAFKLLRR